MTTTALQTSLPPPPPITRGVDSPSQSSPTASITPEQRQRREAQILTLIGLSSSEVQVGRREDGTSIVRLTYESTGNDAEALRLARAYGIRIPAESESGGPTWKLRLLSVLAEDPNFDPQNPSATAPRTASDPTRRSFLESRAEFLRNLQRRQEAVLFKAFGLERNAEGSLISSYSTMDMANVARRLGLQLPPDWDQNPESEVKWKYQLIKTMLEPSVIGTSASGRPIMSRGQNVYQIMSLLSGLDENGASLAAEFRDISRDPQSGQLVSWARAESMWKMTQRRIGVLDPTDARAA